jgi:hypothetical protein
MSGGQAGMTELMTEFQYYIGGLLDTIVLEDN